MRCAIEPWTTKHVEVLRDHAHEGVEAVQRALLRECGVYREIDAIKMYASRNAISLKKRTRCPQCGAPNVKLNKQSGLCKSCNYDLNIEREKIYSEMLEEERWQAEDSPEVAAKEREYAKLRQRNARFKRKHGLKTKKRSCMR